MRRFPVLVLALLFGLPVFASAQAQPTVSYTFAIYATTATDPNVTAPLNTAVYPLAGVSCGQVKTAAPPAGTLVNPTEARLDDPADATKDCVVTIAPQVQAMAVGTYKGALRANGSATNSAYSPFAANSFSHALIPPAVPAGVRVQ